MKINHKFYQLSSGIAFYPEKICVDLTEKAQQGWRLKKINALGFFVYEKTPPSEKQFAIDFYEGKKQEVTDYLTIFQEAGWHLILDYKKRYYFFEGTPQTPPIYSEAKSYQGRIKKEWWWLFLQSFWNVPIGLLIYLFLAKVVTPFWPDSLFLKFFTAFSVSFFTVMPLAVLINCLYSSLFYKKRGTFYRHPEKIGFLQKRKFRRDLLLISLIGGVCGFLVAYFLG